MFRLQSLFRRRRERALFEHLLAGTELEPFHDLAPRHSRAPHVLVPPHEPPLGVTEGSYDLVHAISVWSHFGANGVEHRGPWVLERG